MYKKSIKENSKYLLPFIEGIKYYGSDNIVQGLGTMILLNKNGDVLTCKHIANQFIVNNELGRLYPNLINELDKADTKEEKEKLEKKYNLNKESVVLSNINLPFEVTGDVEINVKFHDYLDLALINFKNCKLSSDNYPIFSKKMPEQGQSVCKLGYAFPEYDIFEYSKERHNIILKQNRIENFPLFPMDGIVTRHILDKNNNLSMFEMSTPGLRGQSGGPIFGPDGVVYGIQCMTKHLDLNFDVHQTVNRGNKKIKVDFTPFINLGIGISSEEIIKFLEINKIEFNKR